MVTESTDDNVKQPECEAETDGAEEKKEAKPTAVHWFREVTAQSVDELMEEILCANEHSDGAGVKLYISSPGGDLGPALHFLHTMRHLVPGLQTFATYEVNSAGVLIFLAGKERFAFPRARFLFHEVMASVKIKGAKASDVREMADTLEDSQKMMAETVAEILGKTSEEIMELCRAEKHIGTDKALEIGLISEVLKLVPTP